MIATEIMIGRRTPLSSKTLSIATRAALAFSVSKIVSTRSTSAPPSTSPRVCSAYDSSSSANVMLRKDGSLTFGESDRVLLVGPRAPATKRGRSGVFAVQTSAQRRAIRAASRFCS